MHPYLNKQHKSFEVSLCLSIVIPAYNEEKLLPRCLASVEEAIAAVRKNVAKDFGFEVIVTDNNSTDATAEVAHSTGARVVFEPVNQISRARNAGAAQATGDWLLFIDADSVLRAGSLRSMLAAAASERVVGGGCLVALDPLPWWGSGMLTIWNRLSMTMQWAAGSFIFCRTDAFREIGGFSHELYAAEEIDLSMKLKRWGRTKRLDFVILTEQPHLSSGRKFELYDGWEVMAHCCRALLLPWWTLKDRQALDFFYDGRR